MLINSILFELPVQDQDLYSLECRLVQNDPRLLGTN